MISLESIVNKNTGILEKSLLGGVTRRSAENALLATAKDVETTLLEDKKSAMALLNQNFEEVKAKQIEMINKKDAEILDLSNKNKALEKENTSLASANSSLVDENSSLKDKVGSLITKLKTKMPFKLINTDNEGNSLFAKPNRNGARMLKTISKEGILSKLEVVLLDGTSRLLFDAKKQEKVVQSKIAENKVVEKKPAKEDLHKTATTPKKEVERPVISNEINTTTPVKNTTKSEKDPYFGMFEIRKHFIKEGVEVKEPWIKPNIPENGEMLTYDKETGNVLKKMHYITPKNARKSKSGKLYGVGRLTHVDEFDPKTGKISQRKFYKYDGYLDRIQKFNEDGKLIEQTEFQNFRATYDCTNDTSYLQEYLYIREIEKYDPETGRTIERIRGNGEKIWALALYTKKDGLKFTDDELMTAGKWNLGTESNVFPVMVPAARNTSISNIAYWKLDTLKEAPLPEMTKIYEVRKYNPETDRLEVIKSQKD